MPSFRASAVVSSGSTRFRGRARPCAVGDDNASIIPASNASSSTPRPVFDLTTFGVPEATVNVASTAGLPTSASGAANSSRRTGASISGCICTGFASERQRRSDLSRQDLHLRTPQSRA